jgi:chromosome segregation ATPase
LNKSNQELQEAEKRIPAIQGRLNTEDVPHLNSEGVGLVNADNVNRTSETYKRGLRPNVGPASEIVDALKKKLSDITSERDTLKKKLSDITSERDTLKKKLSDITSERDNLSSEVQVLKEKTQPELLKELQDKFYDMPGLMDAKQLQKISIQAGRDLETVVRRYNTIIRGAVESGEPVPMGMYIITKPDMKLIPVRVLIDFDKRRIDVSLWEKKLAG